MAQVYGLSGRNAAEEAHKRTKRLLIHGLCSIAALALIVGYSIGASFPFRGVALGWVLLSDALLLVLALLIAKWASDKIDILDRQRAIWRKGAAGEAAVAETLAGLPNDFVVVNDVSQRFGNIDHVVIGPTGIYVIDTKNWRGTVKADAQGELLLNGKPPSKPAIKSLLNAVMDFRSKLKALAGSDYFVRGVIVFPLAYVEATYGSTRQIHCLRPDRLTDYLQDQKSSRTVTNTDVDQIKRATLQLAAMDERFAV
jgi:hypothetical protein